MFVEGEYEMISIGDRLIIREGEVTELQYSKTTTQRALNGYGTTDSPYLTWYSNNVWESGFALGICLHYREHRLLQHDECEGWRFSLVETDTLEGFVAFKRDWDDRAHLNIASTQRITLVRTQ